jgi:F-type H+-transporting ATPase subunit b
MLIDWFTVGAQALNFFILVWLLKRFLYQPILNAIDAREKGIAAQLADADARKAEASGERAQFQRKNAEFEQQRAALLTEATAEAEAQRARLLGDARHAADALRAQREAALRSEHQHLHGEIGRLASEEAFAIARKMLLDLAGVALEERIADVFVQRLQALRTGERDPSAPGAAAPGAAAPGSDEPDPTEKTAFVHALQGPNVAVLVRSAFDLSTLQQEAIRQALAALCEAEIVLDFETAPALVSGIEVSASGQRIAWSIASYLGELEQRVAALLKESAASASEAPVTGAGAASETAPGSGA